MEPFLKLVAIDIFERFGNQMNDVQVVFPNRRSILYFNKYLSQIVDKPTWAPHCITISNFIQNFSKLQKADDLLLLFDLYKIYCKIRNSTETFDSFYYWGELMLSDFDDIDKYLLDAQNLFQNLSALKNINEQFSYLDETQVEAIQQFWKNFAESKSSTHHEGFSDLWSSMFAIYKDFRDILTTQNIAYEGMIYRNLADLIHKGSLPEIEAKKIAFVGFNALNECEKVLFRHYRNSEKAIFYWDYDLEYIENKYHEAGFFIRKNLEEFPSVLNKDVFSNLNKPKNIETIAIPSNIGQAKIVHQLVSNISEIEANSDNTAILLTDENLLMPVLHSIPETILDINITMGFPVKNSPIIALIESIGLMHTQARNNNGIRFYHKYFVNVCSHPYIIRLAPKLKHYIDTEIISRNLIYIKPDELPDNPITKLVFHEFQNAIEFIQGLANIIKFLGQESQQSQEDESGQIENIENETLKVVFSATNRLADLLKQISLNIDIPLAFRILMKMIKNLKVAFEGEPLKGIQVMGFLESRSLDFKNIIIIGVNEGNLPKTNVPASFIPYNLRYGFGLPTLEFRDAMYAYYFYRIIERAENISLVYNSNADKIGASEVSRYVTQMKYNEKYIVKEKVQTFDIVPSSVTEITIPKTDAILEVLKKFLHNGESKSYLSPSALSSYVDCSLRFYFRYVASIKEFETTNEEIDAPMLGNILHAAMQILYQPYIGNLLDASLFTKILTDSESIDSAIKSAMAEKYFKQTKPIELQGRNIIIFRILKKYVKQIISIDKQQAPFTIISLEENCSTAIEITANGKNYSVNTGGNIDRIDMKNDVIKIIDYKTGSVDTKFSSIDELFISPENQKAKKEIFQVILYSLLYQNKSTSPASVQPNLYNLRKIFEDNFDARIYFEKEPIQNINEIIKPFTENLQIILAEIFNTEWPFSQTEDISKCKNCTYNSICHRNE